MNMKKLSFIIVFCICFYLSGCTNSASTKDITSSTNSSVATLTSSDAAYNNVNPVVNSAKTEDSVQKKVNLSPSAIKKSPNTNEKDTLSKEEKQDYNKIDTAIKNNTKYQVIDLEDVENLKNKTGQIKYDFNKDGRIDTLKYKLDIGDNEYGYKAVKKCEIYINQSRLVYEHTDTGEVAGSINSINICDVNKNDKFIEVYLTDGYLSDRVVNTFYIYNGKIVKTCSIESLILNYLGDGNIYYWEGCVDSLPFYGLNKDLVLVYYDYVRHKYCKTDQIIGKEVQFDYEINLYKSKDDVVCGPPITYEDIKEYYSESILRTIKAGQKLKVLSIDGVIEEYGDSYFNQDNGIKVQTKDGTVGWIGGFHMVWD